MNLTHEEMAYILREMKRLQSELKILVDPEKHDIDMTDRIICKLKEFGVDENFRAKY